MRTKQCIHTHTQNGKLNSFHANLHVNSKTKITWSHTALLFYCCICMQCFAWGNPFLLILGNVMKTWCCNAAFSFVFLFPTRIGFIYFLVLTPRGTSIEYPQSNRHCESIVLNWNSPVQKDYNKSLRWSEIMERKLRSWNLKCSQMETSLTFFPASFGLVAFHVKFRAE